MHDARLPAHSCLRIPGSLSACSIWWHQQHTEQRFGPQRAGRASGGKDPGGGELAERCRFMSDYDGKLCGLGLIGAPLAENQPVTRLAVVAETAEIITKKVMERLRDDPLLDLRSRPRLGRRSEVHRGTQRQRLRDRQAQS
jgi:hypothetical protein